MSGAAVVYDGAGLQLSPHFLLLSGRKSSPQWFDATLKSRGVAFLTSAFEGGGLLSQPTLRDRVGPFSVRATLQWLDLLLASLDCYTTFISLHILKPAHMTSALLPINAGGPSRTPGTFPNLLFPPL